MSGVKGPFRLLAVIAVLGLANIVLLTQGHADANGAGIPQGTQSVTPRAAHGPQPALPAEPLTLDGAAVQGRSDAPVVLIEFSDFQCPFCIRFAHDFLPSLLSRYVRTGKVEFAFREFPLDTHADAFSAAEAAECAARQGRFWPMHDRIFDDRGRITDASLRGNAKAAGLALDTFDACLDGSVRDDVEHAISVGMALGLMGTPTFLAGTRRPDGRIEIVHRLDGVTDVADVQKALDSLLRTAGGSR